MHISIEHLNLPGGRSPKENDLVMFVCLSGPLISPTLSFAEAALTVI